MTAVFFSACASAGTGLYYEIRPGETLWSVARMHDTDVDSILKCNHSIKDPKNIMVGKRVRLPMSARRAVVRPETEPRPRAAEPKTQPSTPELEKNVQTGFIWPVKGRVIRSFGINGKIRSQGIVIEAVPGQPVFAAESGKVVFASNGFKSYGNTVIIEHGLNYDTVYAYNRKIFVRTGQKVQKGERIAETGICDEMGKPGLYFEIRFKEQPKNPLFYLK